MHIAFCELLVVDFGMGLEGVAIALNIAIAIPMTIMFFWLRYQKSDEDLNKVLIPFNLK